MIHCYLCLAIVRSSAKSRFVSKFQFYLPASHSCLSQCQGIWKNRSFPSSSYMGTPARSGCPLDSSQIDFFWRGIGRFCNGSLASTRPMIVDDGRRHGALNWERRQGEKEAN